MREVILRAIKDSGLSVNAIAMATNKGISQPSLSRFVNGERDLMLDKADKLAKVLGLKLVKDDSAG